jgi:hypothetical protein
VTYLQIINEMDTPQGVTLVRSISLRNEIDEIDEISPSDSGDNSSISSISFTDDVIHETVAGAAVARLATWLESGCLHALPESMSGFTGDLAQYTDRAYLIYMVRAILDAVPWSLTAIERAGQLVPILTPLIEGGEHE